MIRRVTVGILGAWLFAVTAIAGAIHTQDSVGFIQSVGEEAIQLLSDKSLAEKERLTQLRNLLHAGFDMKTIGRFVLGRYGTRATEPELDEFQSVFDEYIVQTFASRLGQYAGETLQVGQARRDATGDTMVSSEIVGHEGPAIRVDWRLRGEPGHFKIIDVIVEGVSMAITQRSEFGAVIQRSGGKIENLIKELRRKVPVAP